MFNRDKVKFLQHRVNALETQATVYRQMIVDQKERSSRLLARAKEAEKPLDLHPRMLALATAVVAAVEENVAPLEHREVFPDQYEDRYAR